MWWCKKKGAESRNGVVDAVVNPGKLMPDRVRTCLMTPQALIFRVLTYKQLFTQQSQYRQELKACTYCEEHPIR